MTPTPIAAIEAELDAAVKKRPHFCDGLIDTSIAISWADSEQKIKARNATGKAYADNILMEEVAEAFAAIEAGNLKHALRELAQCAAVCIRTMNAVNAEMERAKKK